ncbi:MAG: ABC transporter ATP-binding protein [Bauldia sp.]|jgi:oligopeptide transport system ATP-binding protein|nr:ABC transporter ATP-binding protein [Bauldia sp.]
MAPILEVRDLNVTFALHKREIHAVAGFDLTLEKGETLAVVGESGSGKTQAFLAMMGLLARNGAATGSVLFEGADLLKLSPSDLDRYRGRDIAMIFQDPMTSLNPSLRIGTQLKEVLVRHRGMSRDQALKRSIEMLERVGIPEPARRARAYPHELSGGMRQRVMIAMALLCEPRVLIADEPTTALDVTVQAQMLDLFRGLTRDFGTALVIITHDLGVVAGLADRMMVMYAGRPVEVGPVDDLFYDPRHPYTFGLLQSTPHVERVGGRLVPIVGMPPSLAELPPGCAFNPRCPFVMEVCLRERPLLVPRVRGRPTACFYERELTVGAAIAEVAKLDPETVPT